MIKAYRQKTNRRGSDIRFFRLKKRVNKSCVVFFPLPSSPSVFDMAQHANMQVKREGGGVRDNSLRIHHIITDTGRHEH